MNPTPFAVPAVALIAQTAMPNEFGVLVSGGVALYMIWWFTARAAPHMDRVESALNRFTRAQLIAAIAMPDVPQEARKQAKELLAEVDEAEKARAARRSPARAGALVALACCAMVLTACAHTDVYSPSGRRLAHIEGDAANVTLSGGGVRFHADSLNHSPATIAGGQAAHQVLQGAATLSMAAGAAVATSGIVPAMRH